MNYIGTGSRVLVRGCDTRPAQTVQGESLRHQHPLQSHPEPPAQPPDQVQVSLLGCPWMSPLPQAGNKVPVSLGVAQRERNCWKQGRRIPPDTVRHELMAGVVTEASPWVGSGDGCSISLLQSSSDCTWSLLCHCPSGQLCLPGRGCGCPWQGQDWEGHSIPSGCLCPTLLPVPVSFQACFPCTADSPGYEKQRELQCRALGKLQGPPWCSAVHGAEEGRAQPLP